MIVDEPRELSFEVTAFPVRDGEAWIRLSGRYELALRAPFSAVLDACWLGMDESARIFSRVESSRVLERTDDAAVGEQVAGQRHRERITTALTGEQSAIVLVRDLDQAAAFYEHTLGLRRTAPGGPAPTGRPAARPRPEGLP